MKIKKALGFVIVSGWFVMCSYDSQAGIFNMARYVSPGQSTAGVEPELTLSDGGGFATNLRYQYGLDSLTNVFAVAGMGGGYRQFRLGAGGTFDLFPDLDSQPGIGVGGQAYYYRYRGSNGQLETTVFPYIHKTFVSKSNDIEIEPFLALPLGPRFNSNDSYFGFQMAIGAMVRPDPKGKFNYIGEVGLDISKTENYISGGVSFAL